MKVLRPVVLALVVAALALAASASAAPQGSWVLTAVDVSDLGRNADKPRVAVAADGGTSVVWRRFDGTSNIVQAATRPPGGSFGTPVNLSAAGQEAYDQQVGAGPDGTTTAVWMLPVGTKYIIQAATRPPGGSFGTPVDLTAPNRMVASPQVATGPDGTTTVVWHRDDGNTYVVQAATRPPGGSFGTPVNLAAAGQDSWDPQVAVAPDGATTVVWCRNNGSNWIVQAATRPPGGSFGTPVNLSVTGQDADQPQVAVAPDGATTVVWERDGSKTVAQAATRPAGGSFGTPVNLSAADQNAVDPQVAAGPDGTTTAVWQRYDGSKNIIQAATRPPGGSFGTPVNLSAPGQNADQPQVATGPDGTTTAVWQRIGGGNYIVQASTRPSGGSFGTPVNLSAAGQNAANPQVAAGPDGTTTAVWQRNNGANWIIQAAWTREPFELTVTRAGTGSGKVTSSPAGIDCGTVCSGSFLPGTVVTLTATTNTGSTFTGWSGACTGTASTCQVTMNAAKGVTATFKKTLNPPGPVNPPDGSTAIYNPKTGKVKIRLKCGPQYRPKCLTMIARAVTSTGKRAKVMSSQVKVKNRRAGRWGYATLTIKKKFRENLKRMGRKKARTLWVRITVTFKKKGKKQSRTVHHRYRVLVR